VANASPDNSRDKYCKLTFDLEGKNQYQEILVIAEKNKNK